MQTAMTTPDPGQDILRRNLAQFRKDVDLTPAALAKLIGVSERTVIRWEAGDSGIPMKKLFPLAKALGRDPGDLSNPNPPPKPKPEDLDALFLSTRPGVDVPVEIMDEVRKALATANEKIRTLKKPRGRKSS